MDFGRFELRFGREKKGRGKNEIKFNILRAKILKYLSTGLNSKLTFLAHSKPKPKI